MRLRQRVRRFYRDELGDWIFGYAWPQIIFFSLIALVVTLEADWWGLLAWALVAAFVLLPPLYNA